MIICHDCKQEETGRGWPYKQKNNKEIWLCRNCYDKRLQKEVP